MESSHDPPKKACDRCRGRKVKCDLARSENDGCTSCRIGGIECISTFPTKRRGPKPRHSRHSVRSLSTERTLQPTETNTAAQIDVLGSHQSIELEWIRPNWDNETSMVSNGSLATGQSPASHSTSSSRPPHYQMYQRLVTDLSTALPALEFEALTTKCINLYFEYLYPLMPIVQERDLRKGLMLVQTVYSQQHEIPIPAWPASIDPNLESNGVYKVTTDPALLASTFALITALCAESASMLPVQLFPEGPLVADTFLQASRNALHEYAEADMEQPNANSIAIRYFHSNCLHTAGKPRFSWHIFGEAARLAQMMRLYDESSCEGLDPIEAEFRRRAFWILYIGDKSAAILNNRPITIHKFNFESGITTAQAAESGDYVIQTAEATIGHPAERSIMTGFNFNRRLWQAASDLLLEMRLVNEQALTVAKTPTSEQRSRIENLYVHFMTCLDELPPWLQIDPSAFGNADDSENCPKEFLIQRVNLRVSFHCLRMVITQKLEEAEISTSGTIVEPSSTVALRKTEIARDMVRTIREAPFWALQVNGESCAEKIRLIGASLLEVIHTNQGSPLAARARAEFVILLDVLTRLDSKASDDLRNACYWPG